MNNTFMNSPKYLFTSESVTEGHPDKLCDQISDAVLDSCLAVDPYSRVACETATKTGFVVLMGEITTKAFVNFDELVRDVIVDIGYDRGKKSFDGYTCGVLSAISQQSGDINMGVSKALEAKSIDDPSLKPIFDLLDAIDAYFPDPSRDIDKPFLMPIEDIFSIEGRGTVATGRVERGKIHLNDEIEIVGYHPTRLI